MNIKGQLEHYLNKYFYTTLKNLKYDSCEIV